ncbi:amino acid permease [bacterium]|nr:amino acid permease [bacterium]
MSAAKKFGTFGGVFTPAILTILGVIMYLRLPWIVGQAGLYSAIGIIVVAHIISITTGLSVSSIATDKKVKTGGTYYMISRSLGLPIGGTLGLALFVGLSFSVSLYLIGFSESFLGFWGFEVTKNSIRLAGTIALLAVTVITFISTSLALKTQFFILLAIILSLGSIFLGSSPAVPQEPLLTPIAGAAPFIVLFGIFFPAVTGFEAGVSMSGDLQNPKKSIPIGTIVAISVGLVVYVGMAIFLTFRVTSDQLVNNPNILLEISLFSPLVLAGIWGATLSSALGSILGAPRILQAISIDKITPKFFGVGFGKENEPRNALLLTFVIAEVGILIGELDVIARVVSMFFIATYSFLNMSCAIENWASPDFRPDFRVSKYISILGSITCLIVMIQLDLIAMIGAILILSALFFYLKRKELTLESGDTWEGVWSSVIRAGLDYLNKGKVQQRNWRPNIILFSGGSSARPHLLDLGRRMVDKRGMLSNFDLVEAEGSKMLFRKSEQSINKEDEAIRGIYTRRVGCDDVYTAMETISKFYGFSGIEPNTVLMGWGRNSERPEKLVHTIKTIISLDYNLMLLSYDESRGFGDHRQIDVWWRGIGNTIAFAASLCRFLTTSDEWQHASIRFLLITDHTALIERLHQVVNRVVEDFRVDASIKIINNAVEQKPFYEIIQRESKDADLIINGIPDIQTGEENLYVSKTNAIIESLGTVLLIRASSFFGDDYSDVIHEAEFPVSDIKRPGLIDIDQKIEIDLPDDSTGRVKRLLNLLSVVNHHFEKEYLHQLQQTVEVPILALQSLIKGSVDTIRKQYPDNERIKNHRLITRVLGDFLFQLQNRLFSHVKDTDIFKKGLLIESIEWVKTKTDSIPGGLPHYLKVPRQKEQLVPVVGDPIIIRIDKLLKRLNLRLFKRPAMSTVRFQSLVQFHLQILYREQWLGFINDYVIQSLQIYSEMQRTIDKIVDSLGMINQQLKSKPDLTTEEVLLELDRNQKVSDKLTDMNSTLWQRAVGNLQTVPGHVISEIVADLSQFNSHYRLKKRGQIKKRAEKLLEQILEIPDTWAINHQIMMKTVMADLILLSFKNRVSSVVRRTKSEIWASIDNNLLEEIEYLIGQLENLKAGKTSITEFQSSSATCFKKMVNIPESWQHLSEEIRRVINDLPESVESVLQESIQSTPEPVIQPMSTMSIPLRRKVEYFFESTFLGPMEEELADITAQFEKSTTSSLDVIRLMSVTLSEAGETTSDSQQNSFESLSLIIGDSVGRLDVAKNKVLKTREEYDRLVDHSLRNTMESINLYSLAGSYDQVDHVGKTKREFWMLKQLTEKWHSLVSGMGIFSTNLLYRQSTATSNRKKAGYQAQKPKSAVEHLLSFVESASPYPEIVSALPFYYRHLFLSKPLITKEFWVGRSSEIQRASIAINRFKSGIPGGLAVTGYPGSGKSALCRMIATKFFEKQKIWHLTPPESGSADPDLFESRLKEALDMAPGESLHQFQWPKNSILIIDDIGSWWQRLDGGFRVISRITELIREIGDRCLILINANIATFNFLGELLDLDPYLLDIISCDPFDIKSLKEIVMVRHHSTGLKLNFNGRSEDELSSWALARLFTRSFSDCSGNVGLVLKKWIRCIDTVSKDNLKLVVPDLPLLDELRYLESNQLILITQLLLHTRLSRSALAAIMKVEPDHLNVDLQLLHRAGILFISRNDIIEPNLFVVDYLFQHLQQKGLI